MSSEGTALTETLRSRRNPTDISETMRELRHEQQSAS